MNTTWERKYLQASLPAIKQALRDSWRGLFQESPRELPASVTHVFMLRGARTASGKIVPAGKKGLVLSEYEDEGETGWLVDFNQDGLRCVRVPAHSGLASPLGGGLL